MMRAQDQVSAEIVRSVTLHLLRYREADGKIKAHFGEG